MQSVIFVAPFAMESTLRFVRAAVSIHGLRLGLLSQEPAARIPPDLYAKLDGFQQVRNAMDRAQLRDGIRTLAHGWGGELHAVIGILEQLQEPLAEVRQELGIPGMDSATAHNFRDKSHMKTLLQERGLPCARHCLAETAQQATEFVRDCGFPVVVKPPAGAGAKNTFRVEDEAQLQSYLRALPPDAKQPVLLEEFMTGQEHSFDSVTVDGKHVFHSISKYYPTPLEVMESPWIQWVVLLPRSIEGSEFDDIRRAGRQTLDVLGIQTGLTHMEWFRRPDGSIAISEVAARPPGAQFTTLLSYCHDLDFYSAWARLMAFGTFEPPQRQYAAGAAFLRGQGKGRVADMEGLERAQEELGDLVVEAKLPQMGQPQASSYEGEGYVILRHPETEVVEQGLKRLVSLVRVQLA